MGCGDGDCRYCAEQRSQHRPRPLAALRRQGTFICVLRSVPSPSEATYNVTGVGGPLRGRRHRQLLLGGQPAHRAPLFASDAGVEAEPDGDNASTANDHHDAPGHGRTSGSLQRTAAIPAAIDCATCS